MTLEEEIEFLVWMPKNIFWKKKKLLLKKNNVSTGTGCRV